MRQIILPILFSLSLFSYAFSQILETPYGKAEVLGLKNWSLQKLLDTLSVRAPGISVDQCAVDLKQIGFPEASVIRYFDQDNKYYSVVTLVEPENNQFIKYKNVPSDTLKEISDWHEGIEFFKVNPMEFQVGLTKYKSDQIFSDTTEFIKSLNKQKIKNFWGFISKHQTAQVKELAIWILNHDGNFLNRTIAAALLINFPESDLVWWTLVDALRDPNNKVSTTASQVLIYFSNNTPRRINWDPAINSLFYLINGTNLFAFNKILEVLTATKISKELLPALFAKTYGYLVLGYLNAYHEKERKLSYDFLTSVTGKDFGYDKTKWQNFLKGLSIGSKSSSK